MIKKEKVKKILVISLSNLGDVILTTPVIDALRKSFLKAEIDVLVGPACKMVFEKNPFVKNIIKYNKRSDFGEKLELLRVLRSRKYDLVVDLRNTLLPYLVGARYRTGLNTGISKKITHKKDAHLLKVKSLGIDISGADFILDFDNEDEENIRGMLEGVKNKDLVAIAPGAKSDTKRWPEKEFAKLAKMIKEKTGATVVLVGDQLDKYFSKIITSELKDGFVDLCGMTSLSELAALIKRCRLLITNDSAPMHVASAVDTPCVAIFGPTDPRKYGPTNKKSIVVKRQIPCMPCEKAQCSRHWECMREITPEMVFEAARKILENGR